jgi:hypothetical protein
MNDTWMIAAPMKSPIAMKMGPSTIWPTSEPPPNRESPAYCAGIILIRPAPKIVPHTARNTRPTQPMITPNSSGRM